MLLIEIKPEYTTVSVLLYLLILIVASSSFASYFLFNKFESDKRIVAHIANKEEALKAMKELGGTHSVWKAVIITMTIFVIIVSFAAATSGGFGGV